MIELIPLDRHDWERVAEDPTVFAGELTLTLGAQADLLPAVAQQTVTLFQRTGVTTRPWSGYLAVDQARHIVGTCGFKAPPDDEGVVEVAYFTFPGFEGQGYASAMAAGLVERARTAGGVRRLRAHALPERNASTRILEKVGFERLGEVVDPEDGPVWRWETTLTTDQRP
jgi:ribosomal-protein-alanine N-acetyltransferase